MFLENNFEKCFNYVPNIGLRLEINIALIIFFVLSKIIKNAKNNRVFSKKIFKISKFRRIS